ncbi:MAG: hypothetical protein LBV29_01225, partial [Azoarcus sp.]|nr:hypothetical protein [Azoarcus sp.]
RHYARHEGDLHAELSVNTRNGEFFYKETGVLEGKPYSVQAHGWLVRGIHRHGRYPEGLSPERQ